MCTVMEKGRRRQRRNNPQSPSVIYSHVVRVDLTRFSEMYVMYHHGYCIHLQGPIFLAPTIVGWLHTELTMMSYLANSLTITIAHADFIYD